MFILINYCIWNSVPWSVSPSVCVQYSIYVNIYSWCGDYNEPTLLTVVDIWSKIYQKCAESDGHIDASEQMLITINKVFMVVMFIIELAITLWGTVVVFGAWATWTYDSEEKDELNYCEYSPMTFAFTILLLKWVSSMDSRHII